MHLWGITIKPIIFAAFVLPALVIGVIVFRQLTPAGKVVDNQNLIGTWEGTMTNTDTYIAGLSRYKEKCTTRSLVRLVVDTQTDTTISGTQSYSIKKFSCEVAGTGSWNPAWTAPVPFSADISGSRITDIDLFGSYLGKLSGAFTTDTITIYRGEPHKVQRNTYQLTAPINLLRRD